MIWPAVIVEAHLLSAPVILVGLLAEVAILRFAFDLAWPRAWLMGASINAISAICGLFLIPLAGIAWELFPGQIVNGALKTGTFNPVTWTATFVLALAITCAIELTCLRYMFKVTGRPIAWCFLIASNALSVLLAIVGIAANHNGANYRPWTFFPDLIR